MRLKGIMEPLINSKEFNEINCAKEKSLYPIGTYGVSESGRGYLISGLYETTDKPIFVITHSDMEAKNLYEDLSFYIPNVYYFPTKEVVFYNVDAISGDLRWERLKIIKEILSKDKKIIVTSVDALTPIYTPLNLFSKYTFNLKLGDIINTKELVEKLIQSGYERVEVVEGKGQVSLRGGILDIYSPTSMDAYRIEFFDDEIDSIRTFNIESQRSIDKVDNIEIFPAKEIILTEEFINS